MNLDLGLCSLRPWRDGDQQSLARQANNPKVALHLRERFPRPYTLADAEAWIAVASVESPALNLAIVVQEQAVGGIGLAPGSDIHRVSAEVGYWLGEEFWGRGIATCALRGLTHYAFAEFAILNRLFAYVDADHPASIRVLQKAGFREEGKLIGGAIKQRRIVDQFLFAVQRGESRTGAAGLSTSVLS
jgi:RimJ/RimL family protein N-acetyltransferase